jgi:hypothetical protein
MDWETLYDFQKRFRSEKAISGAALFCQLNLSPNTLQYLYSTKIEPAKKPGTIGFALRQALESLVNSPDRQSTFMDDASLSEKLSDIILNDDNREMLRNAQILDVVVTDEDSNGVSVMCVVSVTRLSWSGR